ncbi:MAG: hypothetical protein CM15mP80_00060 [Alphaproteobacteria bacterium]|nr:MAG: hypothetical protein CM15mP80_00060 [Alphaproteobacteria bacterium]
MMTAMPQKLWKVCADMMAACPADAMAGFDAAMMAACPADAIGGMTADMMAACPAMRWLDWIIHWWMPQSHLIFLPYSLPPEADKEWI